MITVLLGENDYELTKKVAQLKDGFDGTAERFDASELTREQVADIFAGQSLFALKRLVFIDIPSVNTDLWQGLSLWAERLNADTQVVLIEPKPDKRTSTYKWLKKNADVQEFAKLDERNARGLAQWADTYAKEQDVSLTPQQASRLVARAGNDQWELAHAIDKLALAGEVSDEWIDAVTQDNSHENVFALFETVLRGDLATLQDAIRALKLHEDVYRLFGLLNTQALQLAVLTFGDSDVARVAADTGASSSYPYQKLASYAVRLNRAQIRDMIALLADADIRIKSGDADPWMVLESTLVQMASLMKD